MTAFTAAEIVAALKAVHEQRSDPDADQRTAAYWWGKPDDSVAWWLSVCRMISADPIAQSLYLAHVAEDLSHKRHIKDWAYGVADDAAFAPRLGSQRNKRAVESYDTPWGHQAARDGLALALWPHLSDDVPGRNKRCEQYGCRHDAYLYIRDAVESRTKELIAGFRDDMEQCREGRHNRWFRERWENVTGNVWPRS
jgi:hypothetical protein